MAQSNPIVKDADGNVLPKEAAALLKLTGANNASPKVFYGSEWENLSTWGRSGLFEARYDVNDLRHFNKKIYVAVIRAYKQSGSEITDVLLLKNRAYVTAWGKSCQGSLDGVPPGHLIGAVLDTKSKRRLNGKDGCDAPSYPARRAYLLELDTGKIKPFKTDPFWCVNEDELPCGS